MSTTYNAIQASRSATSATPALPGTKAPSFWDIVKAVSGARSRKVMQELAEATAQSRPALSARLRRVAHDDWS